MASRSLTDLEPQTRQRAERFLAACQEAGLDILIYCTWRSHVVRTSPLVTALAAQLQLNDTQLDALFTLAASL